MPSSTPDWSALASHNERLVTVPVPAPATSAGPDIEHRAPSAGHGDSGHRSGRRSLWTRRTAHRGMILQFRG